MYINHKYYLLFMFNSDQNFFLRLIRRFEKKDAAVTYIDCINNWVVRYHAKLPERHIS